MASRGIFLSYRRDDTQDASGRLHDRLVRAFPRGDVFMDVDHIRATQKFPEVLAQKTADSAVMLVVIGKQWLTLTDASGRRRIDDPRDFVRLEVAEAIARGIALVPVLVNGAALPKAEELPEPLRPLVTDGWQAVHIRHDRFGSEVDKLIDDIRHALPPRWVVPPWVRAAAAAVLGLGALATVGPVLGDAQRAEPQLEPEPVVIAPAVPVPKPAPPVPAKPTSAPVVSAPAECVTDSVLGCLRRMPERRFLLMESEVTQTMWLRVMGENPSAHTGCPDCPIENVSWDDSVAFAAKVSGMTGLTYRLPTEEEWEYAARGGQDFEYSGSSNIDAVAWYESNSGGTTHPACKKQRNAFGLCDMSGNVWEWTSTSYGVSRVYLGGSWGDPALVLRVHLSDWRSPSVRDAFQGLRLARSE